MMKELMLIALVTMLTACNSTQPDAYQKDRQPEDRNEYVGAEGVAQHQKDQSYLMDKELTEKCSSTKIDLAIAQSNKNKKEIEQLQSKIKTVCR